ncbi:MAG TPA: hypothetical protein VHB20_09775 [Verrucomicrobiae bacterium]|nr:hypothetical protein [Verrucomicrobiae bacterium]
MNPWKVICATILIFVCGAITGALLVRNASPLAHPATLAEVNPAPVPPAVAIDAVTNTNVVSRTNVVWAPLQAQRMGLIRQMVNRLHLDQGQRDRIAQIIKASQERNKELWEQIAPQMKEELKRVTEEIRHELDPAQDRRFMELLRENRRHPDPNHLKAPPAAPAPTNLEVPSPA